MENYQTFFSSTQQQQPNLSSSSSSLSLNMVAGNPHAAYSTADHLHHHPHHLFQHSNKSSMSNGFLGLMSDAEVSNNNFSSRTKSSGGSEVPVRSVETKNGDKKIRKPRYAFQTRSQVDILDDGYRWRKYGQKAVKNNRFPRSYYRCTHHGCNVKKQVQRLTKDEGVVVTTYEGMHSHPIEKSTDNFEHILSQMQIYTPI